VPVGTVEFLHDTALFNNFHLTMHKEDGAVSLIRSKLLALMESIAW
jgi:hypothetical protein